MNFVAAVFACDSRCRTTFTPPTETSVTRYDRLNDTIAKGPQALYLLSCTQHWKPTRKERAFGALIGATVGSGQSSDTLAQKSVGTWTECPAFTIGGKYALSVGNTSDARLEGAPGSKPFKLEYLSSTELPVTSGQSSPPPAQPPAQGIGTTKVHITSTPSGGEIYIDSKFFGNAPSDIALAPGEHVVRVNARREGMDSHRADHRR